MGNYLIIIEGEPYPIHYLTREIAKEMAKDFARDPRYMGRKVYVFRLEGYYEAELQPVSWRGGYYKAGK